MKADNNNFYFPIPIFSCSNHNVIALSSSNSYAKYMCVYLYSLKIHSSASNKYDIWVLSLDISEENKDIITNFIKSDNISLRFYNPSAIIEKFNLKFAIKEKWGISTYFRLLAPYIFSNYNKLVFTDVDMLLISDIYEAFNIDMKSNAVAACFDVHSKVRINDKFWLDYINQVLGLDNPNDYFNAGFIIFDINKYHEYDLHNKMCDAISKLRNVIWADQDIINSVCNSKFLKLDSSWNYYIFADLNNLRIFSDYAKEITNAKIYHYIGLKPWVSPNDLKADVWWECASHTPYFNFRAIFERIAIKTEKRFNNFTSIYTDNLVMNLDDCCYNFASNNILDFQCAYVKYKLSNINLLDVQILIYDCKPGCIFLYNLFKYSNSLNCKEISLKDNNIEIVLSHEFLNDIIDYILDICFSSTNMFELLKVNYCFPCSQLSFNEIIESISYINSTFEHLHLFINLNDNLRSLSVVSIDKDLLIKFIFTETLIKMIFTSQENLSNCFAESEQITKKDGRKSCFFYSFENVNLALDLYLQKLKLITANHYSLKFKNIALLSFHKSYLYYNAVERNLFHHKYCFNFPKVYAFIDNHLIFLYFLVSTKIFYIYDIDSLGFCSISDVPHGLNYIQLNEYVSVQINNRFLSANANHKVILQSMCNDWEMFSLAPIDI